MKGSLNKSCKGNKSYNSKKDKYNFLTKEMSRDTSLGEGID